MAEGGREKGDMGRKGVGGGGGVGWDAGDEGANLIPNRCLKQATRGVPDKTPWAKGVHKGERDRARSTPGWGREWNCTEIETDINGEDREANRQAGSSGF